MAARLEPVSGGLLFALLVFPLLACASGANKGTARRGATRAPAGAACPAGATYGNPLGANTLARQVRGGFSFLEGPVWVAGQKALYFSDFNLRARTGTPGKIHKYTPEEGKEGTFVVFANGPASNGLAPDDRGMLLAASQERQALVRFDPVTAAASEVVGGGLFQGKPFNCLNDLVVRGDGNVYFTDPDYQKGGRAGQETTAYYRLSPAGVVERIGAMPQPNGIVLSPDGRFLYVSSTGGGPLRRYHLDETGGANGEVTFSSQRSDGMSVDCAGNLYLSSGTILSPAGQVIGKIGGLPGFTTNLAFGGEDRKTLYITTEKALYEIEVNVPGLPN